MFDDFQEVLDEFERLAKEKPFLAAQDDPKLWGELRIGDKLIKRQRQLLSSLMEHMDDCENVLKCFFPPPAKRKDRHHYGQFQEIEDCRLAVKPYRDFIAAMVNHNKHHQGRIRLLLIFDESHTIPAYFVEVVRQGVSRPLPEIHEGGNTAFSFARDLRYHFVHLYFTSHELASTLKRIIGPSQTTASYINSMNSKILSVAQRIENLPRYFLKDEAQKPVPWVKVSGTDDDAEITLSYPDDTVLLFAPWAEKRLKVALPFIGDDVTKSFQTLYGVF